MAYGLMWAGFVAYLGVLAWAPRLGRRLLWTVIAILLAVFACLPPLLSHDVYSYVDYARLSVLHGLNPYLHPPASAPGDAAFSHVTWPKTTSAYGPVFTFATYPLALFPVGVAVHALKAGSALAVLLTAWLVARLAPARGVNPNRAAAFVALNPLVLVHVVGGPHNDSFAVMTMTLGFAALLSGRDLSAGAALLAAVATKASTAVAAPFALLGADRSRRFVVGAAVATLVVAAAAWLGFGWRWLHAFVLIGENQGHTSHLSIPTTTARITGIDPGSLRFAAFAVYLALIAYLLAWTWRGGDWLRAASWSLAGLLLATGWLLPWYVLLPLPAAALSRDRALRLLLLALTAYQLGARIPL